MKTQKEYDKEREELYLKTKPDGVYLHPKEGWYCVVNGNLDGYWPMKEYALAGMETLKRRLAK